VAEAQYSGLNTLGSRFAYDGVAIAARETVEVTTIDSVVAGAGLDRLDVIKLDVEGAEHDVVEGTRGTLGRLHPALVFEANAASLAAQGRTLDGFDSLIRSLGYRLFAIEDDGTLRPQTRLDGAAENYIALARQHA
jgi:hypothetical protein